MKYVIDRVEGDYLVIEIDINNFVNIPKILVPNAKEGDIINIKIDNKETNNRKENIESLINNIFED